MRMLVAISSIGLGHVSRTRAIIDGLKKKMNTVKIDVIAPPPIHKYMDAWGIKVHPLSFELSPLSPIVDSYYEKTGKGLIGLKMALEEHKIARENALKLDERIDYDSYDIVFMDESWELLESEKIYNSQTKKYYMTDFIYYPYKIDYLFSALAVNRFLKKRMERFDKTLYIGLHNKIPDTKWFLLYGEKIGEWAKKHVDIIGPIPPVLEQEILSMRDARKQLDLEENEIAVLFSMGGTKAGYRLLPRIANAVEKLGYRMIVASGASYNPEHNAQNTIILDEPHRYHVPRLVKAFNVIVTFAGLSSITLSAVTGVPTILFPLPKHFEQEENARIATVRWPWIKRGSFSMGINNIIKMLEYMAKNQQGHEGDRVLYHNLHKIIEKISS